MSLRSLSDKRIIARIHKLTRCERGITRRVLLHLNEIERRKLHLKLGYSSMFAYCVAGLGYSESAAARRLRTARCARRFPEVCGLLEANQVNLSTISHASRILSPGNKDEILGKIRGKSQKDVRAIVAACEPRPVARDVVRPVAVVRPVSPATPAPLLCETAVATTAAATNHCRSGSESSAEEPVREAVDENQTRISFTARKDFMMKLEKVKALAWHRLGANPTLEQVFEVAMDTFLAREDPVMRRERRALRKKRAAVKPVEVRETAHKKDTQPRGRRTRHIPTAVRDQVLVRDGARCTYVGGNGRVCGETRGLQVDHVLPVARGGTATPGNLRLLCAYHNRLEAERLFGAAFMERASARRESLPQRQ